MCIVQTIAQRRVHATVVRDSGLPMTSSETTPTLESLAVAVKNTWHDASRVLIFTENDVLYSSFKTTKDERDALMAVYKSREEALTRGLVIQGRRYEVHRFHPPLVYGRSMDGAPEASTGIGIVRIDHGAFASPTFALITYEMPNVSARMVQMLADFATQYLAADE